MSKVTKLAYVVTEMKLTLKMEAIRNVWTFNHFTTQKPKYQNVWFNSQYVLL